MKLFLPAIVPALSVLSPALVEGFGLGRSIFTRPLVVYTPGSLFRDYEQALTKKDYPISSPKYEITDTKDKFQLNVDVPGVKASDINVSIENDMLSLRGERKEEKDNYKFSSSFYQAFSLDPAIDTDKFKAELKDGVLSVSAPKDVQKVEENVQKIPITELTENPPIEVSDSLGVEKETDELNDKQAA